LAGPAPGGPPEFALWSRVAGSGRDGNGSMHHHLLAKHGAHDLVAAVSHGHHVTLNLFSQRYEIPRVTQVGNTSAKDHDVRTEQRDGLRQSPAVATNSLFENRLGKAVPRLPRLRDVAGSEICRVVQTSVQKIGRVGAAAPLFQATSDLRCDTPTTGDRFHRLIGIRGFHPRPQMADLCRAPLSSQVELTVGDQRPANAASRIAVKDHAVPGAGSQGRFAHAGGVRVVGKVAWPAKRVRTPCGQRESIPPFNVKTRDAPALIHVDRSAEPDTDRVHVTVMQQPPAHFLDLMPDSRRAETPVDIATFKDVQLGSARIANPELQLRTADFYSQEVRHGHGNPK